MVFATLCDPSGVRNAAWTTQYRNMRRILRKIAEGEMSNLGDTITLLDPGVVEEIKGGRV